MATILLGEEFETDWASAHLLGALGAELAARGHACVFALRDIDRASLIGAGRAMVLQAPIWRGPAFYRVSQIGRSAARIGGVADMLAVNGLGDEAVVGPTVAAWQALVAMVRPDLVIGHFAPGLMMAAEAAGLPRILAGTGKAMPPLVAGRLPRHDNLQPPVARDEDITRAVNAVRRRIGLAPAVGLEGLVAADARLVFSHPAFDPHHLVRREAAIGPLNPPILLTEARTERRAGVIAILSITLGNIEDIVFGLMASGMPVRIHVRGAPPAMQHYLEAADVGIGLSEAVAAIPTARLLVHQAVAEPAQVAAMAGVPQLLLPEPGPAARFIAERVTSLGVGRILGVARKPTSTVEQAVRGGYGDGDMASHCRQRAIDLHASGPYPGSGAVVAEVTRLLPRKAA